MLPAVRAWRGDRRTQFPKGRPNGAAEPDHKTRIGNHALKPETLMLGYGYDPRCRKARSSRRSS